MLWKLAHRSVLAHRHRTFYMATSLALASATLVVGSSAIATIESRIERGIRDSLVGDLQVVHEKNPPLELTSEVPVDFVPIADAEAAIEIVRADPEVVSIAPRALASGVLLADGPSAPAVVIGIDPEAETSALEALVPEVRTALGGADDILVGAAMAERLGRRPGTMVTVLLPTPDGLLDGALFDVREVYAPPGLPLVDELVAFVRYDALQLLLGNEGYPGVLVVRLEEGADVAAARQRLARAFEGAGVPLVVRTWDEMAGDLLGIVRVGRFLAGTGYLFVLAVVVLGVANVQWILMLEKTREIGLMRALGTTRRAIVTRLLAEASLLSMLSAAVGVVAGGVVCGLLGQVGVPVVTRAMAYALGSGRFFPEVRIVDLALGFSVVALVGPIAAAIAATRVSGVAPAIVLRRPA